jgi:cytochrome c553
MKKIVIVSAALALFGAVGSVQAGDAAAGKAKSAVCAGCHGADGCSTNPMYPKLGGQHEQYLATAINAYRKGTRDNPIMKPMVAALSDADAENLAAYYASQSCK